MRPARSMKRAKREKAAKEAASPGSAGANKKEMGSSGSRPASAAAAAAGAEAVAYVAAEDADALECGVCFHPLKPPIFQCDEGHVVCSLCRDKLAPAGKCHVCGIATRDYHRCHAMERLLESIRVSCPNAAHGCGARPAYYDQHDHCQTCPHAPCHCPGKDCNFLGSTEALLDHFTSAHGWPSTTKISAFETCCICLRDGFNFILADCTEDDDHLTTSSSSRRYLFLLNVTRQSLGCSITVHFTGHESPSEALICVLGYSRVLYDPRDRHKFLGSHSLQSEINVECMDLSNGLPNPEDCFQFVVPDSVIRKKDKKDGIRAEVRIGIINLE
ncbi:hypothetical protein PAHAL_3G120900 [Panicum hallii]|uniref:RING-type E3 ubiquitin transferase n=1 Tax=Panicum hallii TaxID=206008 RepID=A0A2T8KI10_9POAL|nr:putative E3 ubiquitin-protein ligase SINA-like 6 [Panicum hallii]PVH61779.1 hypothetical protein PAHAL_3G120900 [Panicum hallii]